MKIIALLPMKANSERIKNKNMKRFANKPLYHAVCEVLEVSSYISEIVINTDSALIAEDSKQFSKVRVVDRPLKIQGEFVEMNDIINYDLSVSEGSVYVQTHSTNPLLTTETLDSAIEIFLSKQTDFDSMFSVTKLQTRLYSENGKPLNHDPNQLLRTQDLDPVYEENSNFFIFTKESFKNNGNKRIGKKPLLFPMNKLEAIDIDEPEDFELAELLYKNKKGLL